MINLRRLSLPATVALVGTGGTALLLGKFIVTHPSSILLLMAAGGTVWWKVDQVLEDRRERKAAAKDQAAAEARSEEFSAAAQGYLESIRARHALPEAQPAAWESQRVQGRITRQM